ncbi:helix-turn-helix domain-containing protein [Krasilnikovia sp. M28-CT-15]|uniref:AlbA family DNA-binding domain-containing protein n=1 Tax=Krasilnikovia sp. M28-CT-15 TaxID=3373540 RepID=UPI0038768632
MANQTWAILVSIGLGLGLGGVGRLALRRRIRVSWSDAVVAGLLGAACGSIVGGVGHSAGRQLPVVAGAVAVGVTLATLLGMDRWQARQRLPRGTVPELIAGGESHHVEFKSSARYNRHSKQRDERVERVIAKSLAGFLNAEGGILLIGVADDGAITGIEDDYPLIKAPNRDYFELWLRDMLIAVIGAPACATIQVSFTEVDGHDVCVVTAPPAAHPVFLRAGKGQPVALYVRVGNSTRELELDDALSYCVDRWGRQALRGRPSAA